MRQRISMNEDWQFALHRGFEPMGKEEALHLQYTEVTLPHDWQISSPFCKDMEQGAAQGYFDRWGIGWYRKDFYLDGESICGSKRDDVVYRLCFDGIYENSTIWVNNQWAGGRKYGYSSFSLDITSLLNQGKNSILVKVDNTAIPADRWYSGAGIYRKVYLEILPVKHLEREKVQVLSYIEKEKAELEIHTGTEVPVRAVLDPFEIRGTDMVDSSDEGKAYPVEENEGLHRTNIAEGSGVIHLTIPAPVLWSAKTPALYNLRLQLVEKDDDLHQDSSGCSAVSDSFRDVGILDTIDAAAADASAVDVFAADTSVEKVLDEISVKIGLRSVELSAEKGLFINGISVKLKGVCVHQEAGSFGTAVQPEIWRERLLKLKEAGCNALRLAHHLYMPEMLELCDELGFYVYEECFDKWTGGAYGRYHESEWEQDLDGMVLRDRNHPCVLFWGVGNEVENQSYPSMLAILEEHVARVKELDSTRPVSLAMNPHFTYPDQAGQVDLSQIQDIQKFVDEDKKGEIYDIDDRIRQIRLIAERVDLISCNYQEQWYDRIHELIPNRAILGTETYMFFRGKDWVLQNYSDENPWWDVEKRDYCIGGMIWTGIDYLGESIGYPAKGWSGALFSTDMEKRPIAWIHQSNWTDQPVVRFAVMDYTIPCNGTKESWDYPRYETHWDFPQFHGVVIPYMIATNCEQVRLFVNEKEFLLKPAAEYSNRIITGYLPYFPGKVTVIGINGGTEVCRQEVRTPGAAVKLRFESEEQTISLKKVQSLCMPDQQKDENSSGDIWENQGICEKAAPYQMLLKVRAFDREDNPVFRESALVTFQVEGPARILGVDNGDMQSSEPRNENRIHLFNGKASAALLVTGCGRVKVSAWGAGLLAAQSVIVAKMEHRR